MVVCIEKKAETVVLLMLPLFLFRDSGINDDNTKKQFKKYKHTKSEASVSILFFNYEASPKRFLHVYIYKIVPIFKAVFLFR